MRAKRSSPSPGGSSAAVERSSPRWSSSQRNHVGRLPGERRRGARRSFFTDARDLFNTAELSSPSNRRRTQSTITSISSWPPEIPSADSKPSSPPREVRLKVMPNGEKTPLSPGARRSRSESLSATMRRIRSPKAMVSARTNSLWFDNAMYSSESAASNGSEAALQSACNGRSEFNAASVRSRTLCVRRR